MGQIKSQLNGSRDFVDVLTAGALRTNRTQLDLGVVNVQRVFQEGAQLPLTAAGL